MSLGPEPIGVQCPLTSSQGEFLGYWDCMAQVSWATARVGSIAFSPSPSISRCFSIHSSPGSGFNLCFFFTTDVSAPIRPILHMLMVSFQVWDWLWYPMLWCQRQIMRCPWGRNLVSDFCPGRGLNLWPRSLMAANVTTRLRRSPNLRPSKVPSLLELL